MTQDQVITATRAELARTFRVSLTTIDAWREQGMPGPLVNTRRGVAAQFDLGACFRWRLAKDAEQAAVSSSQTDLEEWRARNMIAKAQLAEIKLAEMRRSFVAVEDARRVVGEANQRVRDILMAVPAKLAPALAMVPDPEMVERMVRDGIGEALEYLTGGTTGD